MGHNTPMILKIKARKSTMSPSHTVLQLTGFSGSLGPNDTIVLEATRRNLEYEGFQERYGNPSYSRFRRVASKTIVSFGPNDPENPVTPAVRTRNFLPCWTHQYSSLRLACIRHQHTYRSPVEKSTMSPSKNAMETLHTLDSAEWLPKQLCHSGPMLPSLDLQNHRSVVTHERKALRALYNSFSMFES
jgi:hypothetical protein